MISYLKKMNPALPSLMATILVYGVLVELIGVWFVEDKLRYTTGLLIGIGLALFLSISIAASIFDVLDVRGKKDQVKVSLKAVLRYAIVAIISIAMGYFKLGNIITWFIGVMGLKVAALTQPLIHRVILGDEQQEDDK
ncbi:MAG: hypothetical protein IKX99_03880 [Lachnospiraceae bacterium]|nr:hypothetical protein [Lachnospiraceae bacterium]MBO4461348.1 hypothetical protein [Lachnospiraceae bacterium]MBR4795870.1 hypothetical protein [Lachnospiraceae bacterium]MBR5789225.1 hypothetical protein [Lachnospiraceae bacterium]